MNEILLNHIIYHPELTRKILTKHDLILNENGVIGEDSKIKLFMEDIELHSQWVLI